jgi:hypothetical protein
MKLIVAIIPILILVIYFIIAHEKKSPIYSTSSGALDRYDPVAYFKFNKTIMGKNIYNHKSDRATWCFINYEHQRLFTKNPEKYAPEFDGYCAYTMEKSKKCKFDPESREIVDDKLYLNYGPDIHRKWLKNRSEFIRKANENWDKLYTKNIR